MSHIKQPPNIGERIVVHGMAAFEARVESVEWDPERHDWRIGLEWREHGKSRVWGRDEDKVWYRWNSSN